MRILAFAASLRAASLNRKLIQQTVAVLRVTPGVDVDLNRRFAVRPTQAADLHRPTPTDRELGRSLCLKTIRCLRNDSTIAHAGQLYQIHDAIRATHVQVEQRLDGSVRITHHGRALGFHAIPARLPTPVAETKKMSRPRRPVTPRPTHPWRTRVWPERRRHEAAAIP